jgi:hypothetical protein
VHNFAFEAGELGRERQGIEDEDDRLEESIVCRHTFPQQQDARDAF